MEKLSKILLAGLAVMALAFTACSDDAEEPAEDEPAASEE